MIGKGNRTRRPYQFILAPNVDIGILFIFAISSLAVYGIILGGWASNNKYSMLGGLRSSAQVISYEIPMVLSILGVVLMAHSLNLERIIWAQANGTWYFFYQPLAFLLFMISSFAECNRLPFDLPETEQELVGGYHTEYNAMKLAFFFIGEYAHMVTTSFLMVILFFGGWHFPWIAAADAHWSLKVIVFAGQGDGVHIVLQGHSLDDSAVSLRPAHGPGVEGADPIGAGESGLRDDCDGDEMEFVAAAGGVDRGADWGGGVGGCCRSRRAWCGKLSKNLRRNHQLERSDGLACSESPSLALRAGERNRECNFDEFSLKEKKRANS